MKIAMFTNAFEPIIGGVERSIATFVEDLEGMGHETLVVTLAVAGAEESEPGILRLPAVKEVSGTEFSMKLPLPAVIGDELDAFAPDVIHSHHPFMLGDTALRAGRQRLLPVVFTHHTLYEQYTYQFAPDSEVLSRFAETLSTEYANLCDQVIAPTESIRGLICSRGVEAPVEVVPSGVDVTAVANGDGDGFRRQHGIPADAFVVGYLGRVVEVKNMDYTVQAVADFLRRTPEAWFLMVGDGESLGSCRARLQEAGVDDRVVAPGSLTGTDVADAYGAMDLFAFASLSDTQGIVLVESLSAGSPIVALDATGARDIIQDDRNGRLLPTKSPPDAFADELCRIEGDRALLAQWRKAARERAEEFERQHCATRLVELYQRLAGEARTTRDEGLVNWSALQNRLAAEWELLKGKVSAVTTSLINPETKENPT